MSQPPKPPTVDERDTRTPMERMRDLTRRIVRVPRSAIPKKPAKTKRGHG